MGTSREVSKAQGEDAPLALLKGSRPIADRSKHVALHPADRPALLAKDTRERGVVRKGVDVVPWAAGEED